MQDDMIAGRYRLDEQIGAGGSSRVYSATDLRLDRPVAVKVLDATAVSSADPEAVRRFENEARALAGFSHPNVVQVYDAGTNADGDPYIVLELVDGQSLAALLHEHGPLPLADAVRITDSVLDALGATHATGLVHRDVKPSNVLFDQAGTAKLADFGIARRFDQMEASLTAAGMVVGTPRYLAPEQAAGQPLSPATDVFAAGLLLQEMLVGSRRAAEYSRATVIDLSTIRPDVGPALQAAIRQALHPDPRRRFQTTTAMAAALRHASDATTRQVAATIVAPAKPQPTAVYPSQQRNRASLWWLLVATLVVATVVGIALANRGTPLEQSAADTTPQPTATPTAPPTAAPTDPPPTQPPSTQPPSTQPTLTVAPLIDLTNAPDLATFLDLLNADPAMAGQKGPELRKDLDKILRSVKSAKTGDRLDELSGQVRKWKSSGELDEHVADSLLALIDGFEDD